jgi:class 3 adenylate cyclase
MCRQHPAGAGTAQRGDPEHRVWIRIGIHVGAVSERDSDLYGQAVHAASRVAAEAAGGQILVSGEVRQLTEPQVEWEFVDSGLFWLKGFPERWRLYHVSWRMTEPVPPGHCNIAVDAVGGAGQ